MATSSTPLRLVSLIKQMPKYDKFASDGVTVATADLDRVIGEILPLPYAKRAESVYIGPQRAKIFVAALVIFLHDIPRAGRGGTDGVAEKRAGGDCGRTGGGGTGQPG